MVKNLPADAGGRKIFNRGRAPPAVVTWCPKLGCGPLSIRTGMLTRPDNRFSLTSPPQRKEESQISESPFKGPREPAGLKGHGLREKACAEAAWGVRGPPSPVAAQHGLGPPQGCTLESELPRNTRVGPVSKELRLQ